MVKEIVISQKICMLGTFGVGKTSLVRRFVDDSFNEAYSSTMGVNIRQKRLPAQTNPAAGRQEFLNMILWDIAHLDKFTPAYKGYFSGSSGAIVVYDLTRPQSVTETEHFLVPFLEYSPHSKLIFVANKVDLVEKESLDLEQFMPYVKRHQTELILTSAKNGENVELAFQKLGNLILTTD